MSGEGLDGRYLEGVAGFKKNAKPSEGVVGARPWARPWPWRVCTLLSRHVRGRSASMRPAIEWRGKNRGREGEERTEEKVFGRAFGVFRVFRSVHQ